MLLYAHPLPPSVSFRSMSFLLLHERPAAEPAGREGGPGQGEDTTGRVGELQMPFMSRFFGPPPFKKHSSYSPLSVIRPGQHTYRHLNCRGRRNLSSPRMAVGCYTRKFCYI
jgi:hypothetical protein